MWVMVEPVAEIPFGIRWSPTQCYGCNIGSLQELVCHCYVAPTHPIGPVLREFVSFPWVGHETCNQDHQEGDLHRISLIASGHIDVDLDYHLE
jgi:hypothetical protein